MLDIEKIEAVYTEDSDTCPQCCLKEICPKEGYCLCDKYREDNNLNVEGDFYFIIRDRKEALTPC